MKNFNELIQSPKPVLVDFFSEWCAPSKTLAPILHEVKARLRDNATIIKIDVDKNQKASALFQVKSVPTLMLFKNGNILWRQSGITPANELILLFKHYW